MMYRMIQRALFCCVAAFFAPVWAQEGGSDSGGGSTASATADPGADAPSPQAAESSVAADAEKTQAEEEVTSSSFNEPLPENVKYYKEEYFDPDTWVPSKLPVDPDYTMGIGDRITVWVYAKELNYRTPEPLEIDAEGNVQFPEHMARSPVKLAGQKADDLTNIILDAFRAGGWAPVLTRENFEQNLAQREINLLVKHGARITYIGKGGIVGEREFENTVVGLMEALNPDFPLNRASLRKITITPAKGEPFPVDLYTENKLEEIKLRDGARIEIEAKGPVITISGAVQEAVRVELNRDKKEHWVTVLKDYAGGFVAGADTNKIKLTRYPVGGTEEVKFYSSNEMPELQDGDRIHVRYAVLDWYKPLVSISGYVVRDDPLDIRDRTLTLGEYLDFAGVQPGADSTVIVTRTYTDGKKKRLTVTLADRSFVLQYMDHVLVRSKHELRGGTQHVTLKGAVNNPNSYPLTIGARLLDLLKEDATIYNIEELELWYTIWLVRTDSATTITRARRIDIAATLADADDAANNPLLESGDVILVVNKSAFETDKVNIHAHGSLQNPGVYDVPHEMAFDGLIHHAGGLTAPYPVLVTRLQPNPTTDTTATATVGTFVVHNPEEFKDIPLSDRDIFLVEPLDEHKSVTLVRVTGEVVHSGLYALTTDNPMLADLLDSAIVRVTGDVRYIKIMSGDERVLISVDDPGESKYMLRHGDHIHVPHASSKVRLTGAVIKEALYTCEPDMTPQDYVNLTGGFADNADLGEVHAILPSDKRADLHKFWFIKRWWEKVPCGATVVVPVKPPKKERTAPRGPRNR